MHPTLGGLETSESPRFVAVHLESDRRHRTQAESDSACAAGIKVGHEAAEVSGLRTGALVDRAAQVRGQPRYASRRGRGRASTRYEKRYETPVSVTKCCYESLRCSRATSDSWQCCGKAGGVSQAQARLTTGGTAAVRRRIQTFPSLGEVIARQEREGVLAQLRFPVLTDEAFAPFRRRARMCGVYPVAQQMRHAGFPLLTAISVLARR